MQLLRKKGMLDSTRVLFLPVDDIFPNPDQPRRVFAQEELEELARSIQALGLLQPLTVRRVDYGWELVAGERRLRACKLAGLKEVPCISLQIDSQHSSLLALLRLLKLPPGVLETLRGGGATERHARALLSLNDPERQAQAAQAVVEQRLTVAQTEALVESLLLPPPPDQPGKRPRRTFIVKDVRLFLNTIQRGLTLMRTAGVDAQCRREDGEEEILLTIRIPRSPARPK